MLIDPAEEIQNILAYYDLGELVDYERNERGFVNTSFAITTRREGNIQRRFLRKYKPGIHEAEIQFEHSLIRHLLQQNTLPVACVYPTRQGVTYLHSFEHPQDTHGVFYAIFDFLPGEDKYTWVDPHCTPHEIDDAGRIFARYHSAVSGFTPQGQRDEPRILELFPAVTANVERGARYGKDRVYETYLLDALDEVLSAIRRNRDELSAPVAQNLPQLVVHCDYHPGNLKFKDEQVTGLFDFDWSKLDWRCFDLGLAAWYFFASWQANQDGKLDLPNFQKFLCAYQQTLGGSSGIGLLSSLERRYLPAMIQAGNLYILNWGLDDYLNKDIDPAQYLVYLRHCINFIRWYENRPNHARLVEAIEDCV
jgi:homoserine kinase type II